MRRKDNDLSSALRRWRYRDQARPAFAYGGWITDEIVGPVKGEPGTDGWMEDESAQPMIVLMRGDRQVSTRALARELGVKQVRPCAPATADQHSGYQVGGTSPFGTRRAMPAYCAESVSFLARQPRSAWTFELDLRPFGEHW
jgi:hypothetical protein